MWKLYSVNSELKVIGVSVLRRRVTVNLLRLQRRLASQDFVCGKCGITMPNVWCTLPNCDFYGCEDHIKEVSLTARCLTHNQPRDSDDGFGSFRQHAKENSGSGQLCLNLSRASLWCCLCNKFVSIDEDGG